MTDGARLGNEAPASGPWERTGEPCVLPARSVTVVGLGAMGGSVALTMLDRWPDVPVVGIDPDRANAEMAAAAGVKIAERLEDCDLRGGVLVFATPLDVTVRLLRDRGDTWSRAALVTDVSSLQAPGDQAAREALARRLPGSARFAGSHPMCGTERSGFGAARPDLFDRQRVWVSPVNTEGRGTVLFWTALGGIPRRIGPLAHDEMMAAASHLPQLLSTALALAIEETGTGHEELGPGGRDMVRLARSSPEMWLPLLEHARVADAKALLAAERWIRLIRRVLERGDHNDWRGLDGLMRRAGAWASEDSDG